MREIEAISTTNNHHRKGSQVNLRLLHISTNIQDTSSLFSSTNCKEESRHTVTMFAKTILLLIALIATAMVIEENSSCLSSLLFSSLLFYCCPFALSTHKNGGSLALVDFCIYSFVSLSFPLSFPPFSLSCVTCTSVSNSALLRL